jgi:hypothetical protein
VISPTQTSTCQHTALTTEKESRPRGDSNPQTQQANGHRPTPQNARPLESPYAAYTLRFIWGNVKLQMFNDDDNNNNNNNNYYYYYYFNYCLE